MPTPSRNKFLLITGLAGAGRSLTAKHLEDLGWYVMDNPPGELVPTMVELTRSPDTQLGKVALSVGSGVGQAGVQPVLSGLRASGARVHTLFLDATTETLVRRFDRSRRRHPLSLDGDGQNLLAAIERERELLRPVRDQADVVLDTSELNKHELRARLATLFDPEDDADRTQVTLMSFGYKHGLPLDADFVFDCRFLPNPHWVEHLRPFSGREPVVRDHVLGHRAAQEFLDDMTRMLGRLLPAFEAEHKPYLTIAFGCTGGRHRSVAITDRVAVLLRGQSYQPATLHRDVDK